VAQRRLARGLVGLPTDGWVRRKNAARSRAQGEGRREGGRPSRSRAPHRSSRWVRSTTHSGEGRLVRPYCSWPLIRYGFVPMHRCRSGGGGASPDRGLVSAQTGKEKGRRRLSDGRSRATDFCLMSRRVGLIRSAWTATASRYRPPLRRGGREQRGRARPSPGRAQALRKRSQTQSGRDTSRFSGPRGALRPSPQRTAGTVRPFASIPARGTS